MLKDQTAKLVDFYYSKKRMPTYAEMMSLFGFKSKNAVFRLVQKLLDSRVILKDATGKLLPSPIFSELPVLGSVKAGFPAATEEQVDDTLDLNDYLIEKKDKTYLVQVDGDSMIDAHIEDGDLVIAERASNAKDGDIVIANIDGEFTMKYFRQKGPKVWLEPANKNFSNMYPEHDLQVVSIIKGVIRKY